MEPFDLLAWVLSCGPKFRYQLLDRLKSDCDYYLNHSRYRGHLWAKSETNQIELMKALWASFPEDGKPEWLTWEQIEMYESKMTG